MAPPGISFAEQWRPRPAAKTGAAFSSHRNQPLVLGGLSIWWFCDWQDALTIHPGRIAQQDLSAAGQEFLWPSMNQTDANSQL
jgi:hypothetical protein